MGPPAEEKQTCGQKCGAGFASFKSFLYNPNQPDPLAGPDEPDKTVTLYLGRTCTSWAKIGLFYLIFYGCLAGFFSAMLAVFLTTINDPKDGGPKLTQFIKNQPGLSRIDNRVDKDNKIEYPYKGNSSQVRHYADFVTKYLDGFDYNKGGRALCNKSDTGGYTGETACRYDWQNELGECAKRGNDSFGFDSGKPCFFVKINKVYGWVPKPLNDGDQYLKLSCDSGTVYPAGGFLLSAFPFKGQKEYMAPIVAVKIDLTAKKQVTVTCELQGQDIEVSSTAVESRAFGKIRFKDLQFAS